MILAFWRKSKAWHRWIPGQYAHVSVLIPQDDTWVHIGVGRRGIEVEVAWMNDDVNNLLSLLSQECDLIKCANLRKSAKFCFGSALTCVSFAKHCAGVPSRALFPRPADDRCSAKRRGDHP